MTFLATAFITASMISCNSTDLLPEIPDLSFSIIDGDTVLTKSSDLIDSRQVNDTYFKKSIVVGDTIVTYNSPLNFIPKPAIKPNLEAIKSTDSESFKYLAIGGSLSAGLQGGGYFNEGIEMSFPNLIARQMGIENFKTPAFNKEEYNGFGRQVKTETNFSGGPFPKTNYVTNNLVNPLENDLASGFSKTEGPVDQLTVPGASYNHFNLFETFSRHEAGDYSNNSLVADKLRKRLLINTNLKEFIKAKNPDFFTFEFAWLELIEEPGTSSTLKIGSDNQVPRAIEIDESLYYNPVANHVKILKNFRDQGVKNGVIFKLPLITEIPRYSTFGIAYFEKLYGSTNLFSGDPESYRLISGSVRRDLVFLPNSATDSLLSSKVHVALKKGLSPEHPLPDGEGLFQTIDERSNAIIIRYNEEIDFLAEYFGYQVFDLGKLYSDVSKGNYVTNDGVKIDGRWPEGDFYSTDGIHPSSLGHLIIANEIIKLMNTEKKLDIPYISTRTYLQSLNR